MGFLPVTPQAESLTDYGTDVLCYVNGLDPRGALVSAEAALAQRLLHRFQTPRGFFKWLDRKTGKTLYFHPNDGLDLLMYLNKGLDFSQAAVLSHIGVDVQNEALKDPQVADCTCVPTWDPASQLTIPALIVPSFAAPFDLVFSVSRPNQGAAGVVRLLEGPGIP